MVCVACLLPLFLIPLLNILPKLLDLLMARLYAAVGWEYKAPVRVPASCPYKSDSSSVAKVDIPISFDEHTCTSCLTFMVLFPAERDREIVGRHLFQLFLKVLSDLLVLHGSSQS
ncbi:hypothetical protein O6H91_Y455900 [Diphasiastrum complanatum]|nr:hypothetical protein O6H91_Y455900 [Diphasiastrum complanatum]